MRTLWSTPNPPETTITSPFELNSTIRDRWISGMAEDDSGDETRPNRESRLTLPIQDNSLRPGDIRSYPTPNRSMNL